MKLLVGGIPLAGGIIGGSGELSWPKPTRPGDVIHVETEVLSVTPSRSRPERGMAKMRNVTLNQNGDVLQTFEVSMVVTRRPAQPAQA
jgi:acyl dehydratase